MGSRDLLRPVGRVGDGLRNGRGACNVAVVASMAWYGRVHMHMHVHVCPVWFVSWGHGGGGFARLGAWVIGRLGDGLSAFG